MAAGTICEPVEDTACKKVTKVLSVTQKADPKEGMHIWAKVHEHILNRKS